MRVACWILKARHIHSEFVIRIAFPFQQWFNERASLLPYTYVDCLVDTSHTIRSYPGTFEMVRKYKIRLLLRALIQVKFVWNICCEL